MSEIDSLLLLNKGISAEKLQSQLNAFQTGFPWLKISAAAEPGNGILQISEKTEQNKLIELWENSLKNNLSVIKFVPASGAASRMFKDLFEFIESENEYPLKPVEVKFFSEIEKFAFFNELNKVCLLTEGKTIHQLIAEKKYKLIVRLLLQANGLNYGNLPKGLLLFHKYTHEDRTPLKEHLVEGALYAKPSTNKINIHFTVSSEHRNLFEEHVAKALPEYEQMFNTTFNITFSEQKPSTDTVAVDAQNEPIRENGQMVFRPGGHGALIENLNDLNSDIIFIKNIDNVVPDNFKNITIDYKKLIAGKLIEIQKKCFSYLQVLETEKNPSQEKINEILKFTENELCIHNPKIKGMNNEELCNYLFSKLNRPIRVCGMVKNTGEPGGGPFLTENNDGTVSPQILESSQINLSIPEEKDKMQKSTHFNPVDLVCGIRNHKGLKFDLTLHTDPKTGFISSKSKNGKELKALELPGLWNGAMSDWNTIFVEVPIETFNPVKTVNDLLRKEHQ